MKIILQCEYERVYQDPEAPHYDYMDSSASSISLKSEPPPRSAWPKPHVKRGPPASSDLQQYALEKLGLQKSQRPAHQAFQRKQNTYYNYQRGHRSSTVTSGASSSMHGESEYEDITEEDVYDEITDSPYICSETMPEPPPQRPPLPPPITPDDEDGYDDVVSIRDQPPPVPTMPERPPLPPPRGSLMLVPPPLTSNRLSSPPGNETPSVDSAQKVGKRDTTQL